MASPIVTALAGLSLLALVHPASGQSLAPAQLEGAIEQARLFQRTPGVGSSVVEANGNALPSSGGASDDDSFGDQIILKSQPRTRTFALTGDTAFFYTDNVALTRRGRIDDTFFVLHAGGSWTPRLNPSLEAQLGVSASTFRYSDTVELDFTNLGFGAGLFWTPDQLRGVSLFARYDLIELLSRHGNEILQDHEFTVGAQKVFALGRAHAFTLGVTGMAGFANPYAAQRDQAGMFAGYRLQLARAWETEIFYRAALHFYNQNSRLDGNQVISLNLRYRLNSWAEANAFFSFGSNRSDKSVFNYDVLTTGAGAAVTIRF